MELRSPNRPKVPRNSVCVIVSVTAAIMLMPVLVHSSAWDEQPGHGQLILTTTYLETSRSFDAQRNSHVFEYDGSFRQFGVNAYLDVGIRRRLDLVANLPFPFLRYSNEYGKNTSSGAGDFEVGLKYRLTPWNLPGS
jgi:hypothetical protein